nr:sce7726 family protein [uncultured Lachnoclostridium sp.]
MTSNLILKRFFSKAMLHDLLSEKQNDIFDCVIEKYVPEPQGKTYSELISEVYSYIGKEYRTEYFYKNILLNKLMFKKRDYKKTIALTELPIANSKADFVMINGRGIVYEIKTELDNLDRINSQILDYQKAFSEIFIVTYQENLEKVIALVPEKVGIMQLTKRKALKVIREPIIDTSNFDYYTIFKLLRKGEFENIIKSNGFLLPEVVQFEYYKECFNLIQNIEIETLQEQMLRELKKRMKAEIVELSLNVPVELRGLTYFDNNVLAYQKKFEIMLNKSYGG